jgi:hypothetical protein
VEEPGVSSTKVSVSGPNGAKTSQAAAPADNKIKRKRSVHKMPAAPEPFLLLFVCLRRAMRCCQPFSIEKTQTIPLGTPYL